MPYLGLIYVAILVIALIDIINTDDALVRGMPKLVWILLVVLLPLIGALLWLALGRPTADDRPRGAAPGSVAAEFPEYDRPGRYVPEDPEADREFLAAVRARGGATTYRPRAGATPPGRRRRVVIGCRARPWACGSGVDVLGVHLLDRSGVGSDPERRCRGQSSWSRRRIGSPSRWPAR